MKNEVFVRISPTIPIQDMESDAAKSLRRKQEGQMEKCRLENIQPKGRKKDAKKSNN